MSDGNPRIKSYRDFRNFTKGKTSENMKNSYDRTYYEKMVGNKELADTFFSSMGLAPTKYTQVPIELAQIRPGDRVIDVGCGRGEVVFQTAKAGATSTGIDYSRNAIEIALDTRTCHGEEMQSRTRFLCGDATDMGFEDGSFDKAFLLDVVEHVSKHELLLILKEIRRLLASQGILIIHTSQNLWSRKYGYWLSAAAYRIFKGGHLVHPIVRDYQELESDPDLDENKVFLHINEQSILSLKVSLILCGFRSRIWLGNTGNPWISRRDPTGRFLSTIFNLLGLKYLLGSQIYAVACPTETFWDKV